MPTESERLVAAVFHARRSASNQGPSAKYGGDRLFAVVARKAALQRRAELIGASIAGIALDHSAAMLDAYDRGEAANVGGRLVKIS